MPPPSHSVYAFRNAFGRHGTLVKLIKYPNPSCSSRLMKLRQIIESEFNIFSVSVTRAHIATVISSVRYTEVRTCFPPQRLTDPAEKYTVNGSFIVFELFYGFFAGVCYTIYGSLYISSFYRRCLLFTCFVANSFQYCRTDTRDFR